MPILFRVSILYAKEYTYICKLNEIILLFKCYLRLKADMHSSCRFISFHSAQNSQMIVFKSWVFAQLLLHYTLHITQTQNACHEFSFPQKTTDIYIIIINCVTSKHAFFQAVFPFKFFSEQSKLSKNILKKNQKDMTD